MKTILFVDDEVQILRAMTRLFMDSEYEILTAVGGEKALEILQKQDVNLVISDIRMPVMDGIELLTKVKELYPNTIRVILSGYAEEKIIFNAIQKNIARVYVFKPWENEKMLLLVEQMLEMESMLNSSQLIELVNNMERLPTIKVNYSKILKLIEDDADILNIAELIEQDVSISAQILHVANSAYYGAKTGTIKQAVSYLGLENTRKLVLSTSVIDTLSGNNELGKKIDKIWEHSFVSNKLMAYFYKNHMGKKIPDAYSSAALMTNIGQILLLNHFEEVYSKIMDVWQTKDIDIVELERESFGVSHAEAGAYLLKWWDFSNPIVEVALFHHDPFNKCIINTELVWCAHIANKYSLELMGDKRYVALDERVFEALNVSKDDFVKSLKDASL